MMEFISNILGAFGNFFKWKSSGVAQRNAAKKMVSEEEEMRRERREAVNRAVHEGDADRVNAIASGVLVLVAMLGMMGIVAMMGCVAPKKPQAVYVAADRVITCTTNEEGRAVMWHVPPLVMEDLLNSKVELDEMKKEMKVKEITK